MVEVWKDVIGYKGFYLVSNLGNIKSLHKRHYGKLLRPATNRYGYKCVALYKNKKSRTMKVHRLVAEAFVKPKIGKYEVNHIDGDKSNNIYTNLEWSNRSENVQHAFDNGLKKKGKLHSKFIGYWHTPNGIFENCRDAAKANGCGRTAIRKRSRNPNFPEFYISESL